MLKGERWVPPDLEVAHLPHMMGHPYGGIFLFSQSARMMRPVRYWAGGGGLELIGTLEQATLDIHCPDGGAGGTPGVSFTHGELSPGEPCSHVVCQSSCHAERAGYLLFCAAATALEICRPS
jgi:DNA-directed RNA polymerase I subunit RPA2